MFHTFHLHIPIHPGVHKVRSINHLLVRVVRLYLMGYELPWVLLTEFYRPYFVCVPGLSVISVGFCWCCWSEGIH